MTIINYEVWLVELLLRGCGKMDGWTERQIFGIITIIIIIAIIMISGVIIDSRPYFSFVNNDFPTDKFKRERDVYISPIFDDKFTDKRRFLRRQEGSVKFSPFFRVVSNIEIPSA